MQVSEMSAKRGSRGLLGTSTERPYPRGFEECVESMVDEALSDKIASAMERKYWPLYITGEVGAGKSFAAADYFSKWDGSVVDYHAGHALWFSAIDFVQDIATCRSSRSKTVWQLYQGGDPQHFGQRYQRSEEKLWEFAHNSNFLWVIDDLCVDNPSDTARKIIYKLTSIRQNKPTIYTDNKPPMTLRDSMTADERIEAVMEKTAQHVAKVYDDRVASRVFSGGQLLVEGKDRRLEGTAAVGVTV